MAETDPQVPESQAPQALPDTPPETTQPDANEPAVTPALSPVNKPTPDNASTPRQSPPMEPMVGPPPDTKRPPQPRRASLDARVAIEMIDVRGGVASRTVERAIARVADHFRACYRQAAIRSQRSASGAAVVSLVIDEANRAQVDSVSSGPLDGMSQCLREAASRIKSRVPPDVGEVRVRFKVRFTPSS